MAVPSNKKFIVMLVAALLLGFLPAYHTPTFGQEKPDRFWLAGRYDGNRIVVYFDAVKFEGTMLANARKIPYPAVNGFFGPVGLPASYIVKFQKGPKAEHFAIGDRYDLLLGNATVATIKLTTLVGCETDEGVGNDSFIGALGSVENDDSLLFTENYYAVRRHKESNVSKPRGEQYPAFAKLGDDLVRSDIQNQIAELLKQQLKRVAKDDVQREAEKIPPTFNVQSFTVADGTLRYYVRIEWRSGKEGFDRPTYSFAAWVAPLPALHILAVDTSLPTYEHVLRDLPKLLNVVDLGDGRTGIIVSFSGGDGSALGLLEYHDGANLHQMHTLHSISFGE